MTCPNCQKKTLQQIEFHKLPVDKCSLCQGLWFDYDELRQAKDKKDANLNWLDIDLWRESNKIAVTAGKKKCPGCQKKLYQIKYGGSDIEVDVCNNCQGVWLDKGEFGQIIAYLKEKVNTDDLKKYFKHSLKEAAEIFTGPEELSSEIKDFMLVSKFFQYRLYSQYPIIKQIILHLPFTK